MKQNKIQKKNKKNDKLNSTMQHLVKKKEQTKWFSLQNKKFKNNTLYQKTEESSKA